MYSIDGGNNPDSPSTFDSLFDCPDLAGHGPRSVEHHSTAAVEGWANFVAITAFNRVIDGDCAWPFHIDMDLDLDEADDYDSPSQTLNCGDTDLYNYLGVVVDYANYSGDWCGAEAFVSTETDWTRFFWDLADSDLFMWSDIVDIVDNANPHNWNKVATGGGGDPPTRIWQGAAGADEEIVELILTGNGCNR